MAKFDEQLQRMRELMTYGAVNENKNKNVSNYAMEYHAIGADGKAYGIIRENKKFYIKVADKKDETIAEAYKYIGTINNKKANEYSSLSKAMKDFDLKMMELKESHSPKFRENTEDFVCSGVEMNENTQAMLNEIARMRQIMNNAAAIMNEGSAINVKNVGVPEAPATQSFSPKSSAPFTEPVTPDMESEGKTASDPKKQGAPYGDKSKTEKCEDAKFVPDNSVADKKPSGGKAVRVSESLNKVYEMMQKLDPSFKVNEACEDGVCDWDEGLPSEAGVGSPDGHLMENDTDDIAGFDDAENAEDVENVDDEEFLDLLSNEGLDGEDTLEGEEEEETDAEPAADEDEPSADADADADVDADVDNDEPESDEEDDQSMEDGEAEAEDDMGLETVPDAEEDSDDEDVFSDEDDFDDEDDFGDEDDFDDEDDFGDEDDFEDEDEDMNESGLDDDYDFDIYDDDALELDDDDFNNLRYISNGAPKMPNKDMLDDVDDEDDEDDIESLPESRKRALNPIVESVVADIKKSRLNEDKLNVFGKHPGYRKKPMSLPQTGSDNLKNARDWNDDSVYSEEPFGKQIGSSAPYDIVVDKISESIVEALCGKKKA